MTILARGEDSLMVFKGKTVSVTPIVYMGDENCDLGPGFICDGDERPYYYGVNSPLRLVHAWRAMKILEAVSEIKSATLAHCRYAANVDPTGQIDDLRVFHSNNVKILGRSFMLKEGGLLHRAFSAVSSPEAELARVREKVLSSFPSDQEWSDMLDAYIDVRSKFPDVSFEGSGAGREILQYIVSGDLPSLPQAVKIMEEERVLRYCKIDFPGKTGP